MKFGIEFKQLTEFGMMSECRIELGRSNARFEIEI